MSLKSQLHHVQHGPRVFSRLTSFGAMTLNLSSVVRRETSPQAHTFETLVPRWWWCLERLLVGSESLGAGLLAHSQAPHLVLVQLAR